VSLLKGSAWGLILALSTASHSAGPDTQPHLSVGEFMLNSVADHTLIYHDACVSKYPRLAPQFDGAAAVFRSRYKEAVAPLLKKYGAGAQFNLPAPASWAVRLARDNGALRDRLSDVDLDSCKQFLSNLRGMDISGLLADVESSLDRLSQVPPEQLEEQLKAE
jgi:hypothetical protein